MAEVTFNGFAPTPSPEADTELLPANLEADAEVRFFGIGASAPGEHSTQVQIFSPTLTGAPEFTEISFDTMKAPINKILSPNINDILLVVIGGPTSGSKFVNVRTLSAQFELNGDIVNKGLVNNDLRLFRGPLGPSGLVGKTAQFIQPTGVDYISPMRGVTGKIHTITEGLAPGTPTTTANVDTMLIEFESALNSQPTIGDRFIVPSTDVTLRRTPILEIFLSQFEE